MLILSAAGCDFGPAGSGKESTVPMDCPGEIELLVEPTGWMLYDGVPGVAIRIGGGFVAFRHTAGRPLTYTVRSGDAAVSAGIRVEEVVWLDLAPRHVGQALVDLTAEDACGQKESVSFFVKVKEACPQGITCRPGPGPARGAFVLVSIPPFGPSREGAPEALRTGLLPALYKEGASSSIDGHAPLWHVVEAVTISFADDGTYRADARLVVYRRGNVYQICDSVTKRPYRIEAGRVLLDWGYTTWIGEIDTTRGQIRFEQGFAVDHCDTGVAYFKGALFENAYGETTFPWQE